MPNYKSKMLTFLSVSEMTSLALDSTDEDGILFSVAINSTDFKMVMWRKTSSATVDNETVYAANGPGRWHVLPSGGGGGGDIIQFVSGSLPDTPDAGKSICILYKSDPDRVLTYHWDGIWQLISYTNVIDYAYSDAPSLAVGDALGQMFFGMESSPRSVFVWDGGEWQRLAPF